MAGLNPKALRFVFLHHEIIAKFIIAQDRTK
jgi:hypothetical protein